VGLVEQSRLVSAFVASMAKVRSRLTRVLDDMFTSPKSWREADAARFVERAVPAVQGAQRTAASLTDDFLSRMIADQTGEPYRPHGVDQNKVTGAAPRNGTPPEEVYRRPYEEVWSSLAEDRRRGEEVARVQQALEQAEARQSAQQRNAASIQEALRRFEEAGKARSNREQRPTLTDPTTGRKVARPNDKPLTEAVGRGQRRAKLLGLTDVELAVTHTVRERLADEPRYRFYRRVLTGMESCGLCVVASTQRYRKRDLLPIHPNCVPTGTSVRARNISGATRRWYTGELAVLTTARGDHVSVTPNHPVLTKRGWVPAGAVREGDYLVRAAGSERVVGHSPDEGYAPALAEDVWRSLAVTFGFVQVPLASEDFHGDGADSEVDVVRADGYFSAVGDVPLPQVALEDPFLAGHVGRLQLPGFGASAALVPAGASAAHSLVGSGGLTGALFGGHLCGAHLAGVGWPSAGDAGFVEPSCDDIARDPMSVREDVLGESVLAVVDPELFSRVTDVGRVDFAGHVFNFHTRLGTYEANSHIVHNCDCAIALILGEQDPGHIINSKQVGKDVTPTGESKSGVPIFSDNQLVDLGELLDAVHKAVQDEFGFAAMDARRLDYRKVITVHEHGELGPTLTVARHKFTKRQVAQRDFAAPPGSFSDR